MKLNADVGRTQGDHAEVELIANSGKDREILKILRDETTLIVLMVRVANQNAREEWEIFHTKEMEK